MMKGSILRSRTHSVPAVFGVGTGHVKHATRPVRVACPMLAAAVEEPQTSSEANVDIDRDALYARFESLLGDYSVNLSVGDKVR